MPRTDYRYLHDVDARGRRLARALFSAVIPGAGQITAGARRRGFVMLTILVLLVIAGVAVALQGIDRVLSWVIQPSGLSISPTKLITVGFTPPDYITGRNSMGYNILDLKLVQATMRKIIEQPDEVRAAQEPNINVDTSDCWKID